MFPLSPINVIICWAALSASGNGGHRRWRVFAGPLTPSNRCAAALRLTTWAGLSLQAGDIVNLRLALMALLPNAAGLLLAFAAGLTR